MEKEEMKLTENCIGQIGLWKEEFTHDSKEWYIAQITEFRDFANDDTKKNVRLRLKLSDGFS